MKLTPGKLAGMKAVSDSRGVIAAAAMDQRGSLQKALAKEKGGEVGDAMMEEFKTLVTEVLTPHASAILLDPEWGIPASKKRAKNAGLLMAYEKTGYDKTGAGPAAGSARQLVGPPAQGSGRRLHQDPPLLHAVRSEEHQRHQARVGRAHRRRVPRERHPVLSRVRRLRRGRRREGPRVREEEAGDRHRQHGGVHQGSVRRGRDEGRGPGQHEVRRGRRSPPGARRPTRARKRRMPSASPQTSPPSRSSISRPASATPSSPRRWSWRARPERVFRACSADVRPGRTGFRSTESRAPGRSKRGSRSGRREHQQRQRHAQAGAPVVRVLRRQVGGRAEVDLNPAPQRRCRFSTPLTFPRQVSPE